MLRQRTYSKPQLELFGTWSAADCLRVRKPSITKMGHFKQANICYVRRENYPKHALTMKKLSLITLMALMSFATAFGQLKKGDIFVGAELGNIGFGIAERPYLLSGGLAPQAGLMLSSKFAMGIRTKFQYTYWRSNLSTGHNMQYEAGIFGRYWLKNEGVVRPFVELAAGAGTDSGIGRNYNSWMYQEGFGGVSLMVSDRTGIDLGLGLRAQEPLRPNGISNNVQLKFKVGLNFYLDGKKKK